MSHSRLDHPIFRQGFFLMGYLKSEVYQNNTRTLDELKQNILNEIIAITSNPNQSSNSMHEEHERANERMHHSKG